MKQLRFKSGDMVHVVVPTPHDRSPRYVTSKLENDGVGYDLTFLDTNAMVLKSIKRGDDEFVYVLPNEGPMGWLKVSCCVRHIDDDGKGLLHEVQHVNIIKNMRDNWDEGSWAGFALFSALAIMVVVGIVSVIAAIRSNGRIDHCYTSYETPSMTVPGMEHQGMYVIHGHRPWRSDATLGSATTGDEANALMKRVCPVQ